MSSTLYPKIVALDTDWTLFRGWLDQSFGKGPGSIRPVEDNLELEDDWTIKDRSNRRLQLYANIPVLISDILRNGADIAIVARNTNKNLVDRVLCYFKAVDKSGVQKPIIDIVKYNEVYDRPKTVHFERINKSSKVDYSDMILFDDDAKNNDVRHMLGVTFQVCRDQKGLSWDNYHHGIEMWRRAKSIRSPYLGQNPSLYPKAGFIGYVGVDEATLQLLMQGKSRIDTKESARWGYATYITDDPAMAKFFAEWIKEDTFGSQARTYVCEVWVRDWSLWRMVPKIWYPEIGDHQTDNKHWDAGKIAWRQEDRDSWINALGVQAPYVLFSRHHWMNKMPIPTGKRFTEMVIYRQVQDALLLTFPLSCEQLEAKLKSGFKPFHEHIQDWNIVVPSKTVQDFKHGKDNDLLRWI